MKLLTGDDAWAGEVRQMMMAGGTVTLAAGVVSVLSGCGAAIELK